jgi:hypothetical protein
MTPVRVDTLVLDVVVPVYNEEADLEPSVHRLHAYLRTNFPTATGSRSRTTRVRTEPRPSRRAWRVSCRACGGSGWRRRAVAGR